MRVSYYIDKHVLMCALCDCQRLGGSSVKCELAKIFVVNFQTYSVFISYNVMSEYFLGYSSCYTTLPLLDFCCVFFIWLQACGLSLHSLSSTIINGFRYNLATGLASVQYIRVPYYMDFHLMC